MKTWRANPAGWLVLLSLVVVVGCAGGLTTEQRDKLTPQARMYEIADHYALAQAAVLRYLRQDTCTATLVVGCKELSVVNVLADADQHANTVITTAVAAVRASTTACEADTASVACTNGLALAATASRAARVALAALSTQIVQAQAP